MTNWQLGVGWDKRFSIIGINLHPEGEESSEARFYFPLAGLLKDCGLTKEEVLALFDKRYDWTEGYNDIDGARVRLLEETDWAGKTVIDIGGYDGFAAEIAHKGGAARAICLDNRQYDHYAENDPGHWLDVRKKGVEYVTGDLMDWTEPVDTVIFFNVLYHLRHPWAAMDHLRTITKGELLLCTLFRYSDQPTWHLYEPLECNPGDRTVYWGPSLIGLERMLKFTGWTFEQYALSHDRVLYRCKPIPGFKSDLADKGYARA